MGRVDRPVCGYRGRHAAAPFAVRPVVRRRDGAADRLRQPGQSDPGARHRPRAGSRDSRLDGRRPMEAGAAVPDGERPAVALRRHSRAGFGIRPQGGLELAVPPFSLPREARCRDRLAGSAVHPGARDPHRHGFRTRSGASGHTAEPGRLHEGGRPRHERRRTASGPQHAGGHGNGARLCAAHRRRTVDSQLLPDAAGGHGVRFDQCPDRRIADTRQAVSRSSATECLPAPDCRAAWRRCRACAMLRLLRLCRCRVGAMACPSSEPTSP